MRLRITGAVVCATCAVAASNSPAVAKSTDRPPSASSQRASGAKDRLVDRNMFLSKRLARVVDDPLTRSQRSRRRTALEQHTVPELRRSTKRVARTIRYERHGGAPDVSIPPQLKAIAECESGGDPRAISAGGTYRGKYQFSFSTWRSVGGKGDPARASETEQDRRAAILYRKGGPGHWPVCGR